MSTFVYTFLLILISNTDAAKILAYFPFPSLSHQLAFRPLIHELARRGHEVVTITPDPAFPKGEAPANLTEIDVHNASYALWRNVLTTKQIPFGNLREWINQPHRRDLYVKFLEMQFSVEEVKAAIFDKSNKYDLLILEACVFGILGLSHLHKVPVIQISSFGPQQFNLETVGAVFHLFRQPLPIQNRVMPVSLWDKMYELLIYYDQSIVYDYIETSYKAMLKESFGENCPELRQLRKNVDMLFLNVHPLWELNRPVPPNVINIGGLHQISQKEIPQDLKSYLDASKNGVVYVSFGTNVSPSLFSAEKIQTLVNVFSKLPYDVLWKWNLDELPGRTANIKISKWFPQSDLLRHPNIKLFITQAGLQSTDEAITAGVPVIGIPLIGDQWYNAELYEYHKIGLRVDFQTITEDILLNAITTVINDKSYRTNIVKLRAIMQDQVQSPLERAVWWTEYVLRHGGAKHLRSPLANLTWTEYLELDLVLILITILISSILFSFFVIYSLYKVVVYLLSTNSKVKTS